MQTEPMEHRPAGNGAGPTGGAPLIDRPMAIRSAMVAATALCAALLVPVFKAGHLLGASGAGAGNVAGGCLFWAAVGLVAGQWLSGRRLAVIGPARQAAAEVNNPGPNPATTEPADGPSAGPTPGRALTGPAARWLTAGAASALAFAVAGGRSASAALALLAVVALAPGGNVAGWVAHRWEGRVTAPQATLLVAGGFAGGTVGLLLPRSAALILAVILVVAIVLLARKANAAAVSAVMLVVAATALTGAGRPSPAGAEPVSRRQVRVAGDQGWTPAKIKVTAGEVLRFRAKGSVTFLAGDSGSKVDPDGYPARYSGCGGPGFCGVLVGRIGPKGTPFLIGTEAALNAPAAGDLELGVNDYDPSENKGSFEATVTVEPAGTPLDPASNRLTAAGRLAPKGGSPSESRSPGTFGPAVLAAFCAGLGSLAGGRSSRRLKEPSTSMRQSSGAASR